MRSGGKTLKASVGDERERLQREGHERMGGSRKQPAALRIQSKPENKSTAKVMKAREGIGPGVDETFHDRGTDRR